MNSFEEKQQDLAERIQAGEKRYVFIDPDGTLPSWLVLVIERNTGIVYGTQCAGLAVEQRLVEGYLVPLGGSKYEADGRPIALAPFTDVFHQDGGCKWDWKGEDLPSDELKRLQRIVGEIPYWTCEVGGKGTVYRLRLDHARIAEIAEAWIPVETPDGPGVLLYKNCD